jgi:hypothetical protein
MCDRACTDSHSNQQFRRCGGRSDRIDFARVAAESRRAARDRAAGGRYGAKLCVQYGHAAIRARARSVCGVCVCVGDHALVHAITAQLRSPSLCSARRCRASTWRTCSATSSSRRRSRLCTSGTVASLGCLMYVGGVSPPTVIFSRTDSRASARAGSRLRAARRRRVRVEHSHQAREGRRALHRRDTCGHAREHQGQFERVRVCVCVCRLLRATVRVRAPSP